MVKKKQDPDQPDTEPALDLKPVFDGIAARMQAQDSRIAQIAEGQNTLAASIDSLVKGLQNRPPQDPLQQFMDVAERVANIVDKFGVKDIISKVFGETTTETEVTSAKSEPLLTEKLRQAWENSYLKNLDLNSRMIESQVIKQELANELAKKKLESDLFE